jgi:hypothetical protein
MRFVIVGEIHGTAEAPAIFGELVCAAVASGRPVVVGLERLPAEEDALRNGSREAVVALQGWQHFDGRSSAAMLELVMRLREMKLAELVGFAADGAPTAGVREERMAAALEAASKRHHGALVIALTGNLHGSKKPIEGFGNYPFMAMLMQDTVSLLISDRGGTAWTSTNGECAPHAIKGAGSDRREIVMGKARMAGYDGELSTGAAATASDPAAGGSGCGLK